MKKKGTKGTAVMLAAAMVLGMLAGCGGAKQETGKATEKNESVSGETKTAADENAEDVEFTFSIGNSNTTGGFSFDPAVDYQSQKTVTMGIGETLFVLDDETKEVCPHLAESIEQKDDTTWEITVRNGITFSNGRTLDAEAVKQALEYIFANNTRIGTMADCASMEADGQILTIKTNGIVAIMPRILTEVNTVIFDTEASNDYSKGVIGTGPYILESVDGDGNCELVRNENYWQGKPVASKIHTKAGLDASALTLALQSKELDWAGIQTSDLPLFENNPEYKVLNYNPGRVYYLYLNPNYTFTEDDALREALTYAFDREAILNGVYGGRGTVSKGIFPKDSAYYNEKEQAGGKDYDADQAKKILADAGYVDTDGDGFLEKDGETVHLNIICYSANSFPTLSEVIQAELKAIGIDSEITVSDAIVDDCNKGEYNIATYAYNTQTLGDCYNYLEPVFRTGGTANFTGYSNAEVDALLDEMKVTADNDKRAELAKAIQEKVFDANEHIYLLHINRYNVVKSGVEGITPMFGSDNGNCMILWQFTKKDE